MDNVKLFYFAIIPRIILPILQLFSELFCRFCNYFAKFAIIPPIRLQFVQPVLPKKSISRLFFIQFLPK